MKRKKFLRNPGTLLLALLTIAVSIDSNAGSGPIIPRLAQTIILIRYNVKASSGAFTGKFTVVEDHHVASTDSNTSFSLGEVSNLSLTAEIAEIIVCMILLFVCLILALFAFSILSSFWTKGKYKVPPL